VQSEPGQGSTFSIFLPAHKEVGPVATPAEQVRELPRGRGETILVVDDEATVIGITRHTLETFGYRVLTASDGAQAVAQYAAHRQEIAVVLTDLMMPVMDGVALAAALKRIDPGVQVIGASGLESPNGTSRPPIAGVDRYLSKPYAPDALLRAISKTLAGRVPSKPQA
jgi:CheY-like chemotaxis protein